MNYVQLLFPHIENPSEKLKQIARAIWELFEYGDINLVNIETKDIFGILENATEKARKKVIEQMKMRIETIRTYRIEDESIILKMLFLYPYPELMPKINKNQLKLLSFLNTHPTCPINRISRKIKKSYEWVKQNINYLLNKHLIGISSYVDVTALGLKPVCFLFYVDNAKKSFFKKIIENPFLVNILEIEMIIKSIDFTPYFVVFYIPQQPKPKRIFQNWLRSLLSNNIVKRNFYRFEPNGLIYTLNIQMFDGVSWVFDLRKDVLSQFYFTKQTYELLPLNSNIFVNYIFRKLEHITSLDLFVASFLELNARIRQTEILHELKKLGFDYSKKAIFNSFQKLKPFLYPYLYLWYGLKDSFYAFIELNSIRSSTEVDFLLRYFSNALPLSFQYFCDNGLIVFGSYPPELSSQIYSVFTFLKDYYDSIDLYTNVLIVGRRMLRDLIPFWNEKEQYWITEEEMFQPYIVRKEEQKDIYRE